MVVPFLLLLFFLMVDFGWIFKNYLVVTNTGREVARCAVVSKCTVDGAEVGPFELAESRLNTGLLSNLDSFVMDVNFTIEYTEQTGDAELNRGDSIIVCIQVANNYISPVIPFLSMVTGGTAALPDPLPLRARTEMRAEKVIAGSDYEDIALGDGSCSIFS
jgi:Flp pilus assembly protein TadG